MSQPQVMDVEAIDGMLMMTQYDLLWDDRSFDAFHFYDISQCMEFAFAGYRIVLPVDEDVWALHDSGISGERGYDDYRKKFCENMQTEDSIMMLRMMGVTVLWVQRSKGRSIA